MKLRYYIDNGIISAIRLIGTGGQEIRIYGGQMAIDRINANAMLVGDPARVSWADNANGQAWEWEVRS